AEDGLTAAEVAARVADGRINTLPDARTRTVSQIVRANVLTRFNALLGSMFVLILVTGHLRDGLFGLVLVANALIGIVQEVRAKRTLDRLTLLTAPKARVRRSGAEIDLPVGDVVQDDLLMVSPGSQLVVDGEVTTSEGLELDESLLTGESDAAPKAVGDAVLSGSFVAAGNGSVRATKVGVTAYAATLAVEAKRFALTSSELRSSIDRILTWVTWAIVPTAALLFASQLRHHADWRAAVTGAVAGTVAMVPEGLVLLTSVAFAMSVLRLSRAHVLVQELPAVEGLARVDVLCIDKTGTLTEGRLTVRSVEPLTGATDVASILSAFAAADPSPNATMRAIGASAGTAPQRRVSGAVPFSSTRRWSAVAFEDGDAFILGGADVIPGLSDPAAARAAELVADGGRVLVLAASSDGLPDPAGDLDSPAPLALISLGDTIRADAAETLAYFAEQDVRVMVLSGDDPRTVGAIAAQLEVPGADRAVDARDLPDDPAALVAALAQTNVFGRVTPHRKRDMVAALQAAGHTVAMTGDGVNDALALKSADIGIAMGSGSDATRAVAQLVLLDSRFSTMPAVVAEGRRVLANIEHTSGLYLTKTVYAMLISLAVGVAGFAFPFLPRHLTLIGAITIGIPSFFLALAPNARRFLPGFLRRVVRFAAPTGALAAVATFLAYALAKGEPGVSLAGARTTAVMVLTWIGLLVLSIVAAPLQGWRLALVGAMAGLFVLAMTVPGSRTFFALEVPKLIVWLAGMGIAAIVWSFARLFVPQSRPVGDTTG
ncbi:MAG: cation-transporting P-type ATPase, partial [Actinomycetota bacterium]|nr:cation-transporting P-type ATPase [Actinomycetota bacterium]